MCDRKVATLQKKYITHISGLFKKISANLLGSPLRLREFDHLTNQVYIEANF